ncbi:baseplate J/gp47 family protein [Paraburkholderia fynbosensis]|uniref:Uncharacterized protein n=1 Tax=Paraburkholderia fynbosensis TaxID=1200993 RepID=A0A6J5GLJ4_9BURK|nr:baseplate J/gp47 family protein [Paraburkholderia fynbosensis]CAB3801281.1 hypothetical protein LMG27177_05015 [Paraburkholderia fynbosensis]
MIYFCAEKVRRARVLGHAGLNGIDFLEVDPDTPTQLHVVFLKCERLAQLQAAEFVITGGETVSGIVANSLAITPDAPNRVIVTVNETGDFSGYTLTLHHLATCGDPHIEGPPHGFDPALARIDFSFKAGCPTIGDCKVDNCCPSPALSAPDINYLAKDFQGFRQVMLDRMWTLMPDWTEQHAADPGIAVVEALAYVADHLSYRQDAVGTEAYLGTARSRVSLRRHARLVDYTVSDGSCAHVWLQIQLVQTDAVTDDQPAAIVRAGTQVYSRVAGALPRVAPDTREADALARSASSVFTTLADVQCFSTHDTMQFHTWSDADCCLPAGATEATLVGTLKNLQVGDVLVLEEVLGPNTGQPEDADQTHRWAVRLTAVRSTDYLGDTLIDPVDNIAITHIAWKASDALPFPLCVSATFDNGTTTTELENVSVARGNVVAGRHGMRIAQPQLLDPVPAAPPAPVGDPAGYCCGTSATITTRPRYYPALAGQPLSFAAPVDPSAPASALTAPAPPVPGVDTQAVPLISLVDDQNEIWTPVAMLLGQTEPGNNFVVEIERDGTAFLRFGDDTLGVAPLEGTRFSADYWIGNGSAGNVGRDALAHIVSNDAAVQGVRNPLPAAGGVDAESMEHIRQAAPVAFNTQMRAVTEDDYGEVALRDSRIKAARGRFRWTGSWRTTFVTLEPSAGQVADTTMIDDTLTRLDLFRMAGTDLEVEAAVIVGLKIVLHVCVDSQHFRTDVRQALTRILVSGDVCDGTPGLLAPVNFSLGETVYLSPLLVAVQAVEGVTSVNALAFQRLDDPLSDAVARGYITMNRLELASVANDPSRLDRGYLTLTMDGGK